jgi:hypothetical protein
LVVFYPKNLALPDHQTEKNTANKTYTAIATLNAKKPNRREKSIRTS